MKCDCCKREFDEEELILAKIGEFSFLACEECQRMDCNPIEIIKTIIISEKCGWIKGFYNGKGVFVYENDKYVLLEEWVNKEKLKIMIEKLKKQAKLEVLVDFLEETKTSKEDVSVASLMWALQNIMQFSKEEIQAVLDEIS